MPNVLVRELVRRHTAVVRVQTTLDKLPEVFDKGFSEVFGRLGTLGIEPTDPPFARYFAMEPQVDLEIGVAVAEPITAAGRVQPGELPGGRVATTMHQGPYEKLSESYDVLYRWITENGMQPSGAMWETYLTDPSAEPDSSKWLTELHQPVTNAAS